jgi:hypothetical protein
MFQRCRAGDLPCLFAPDDVEFALEAELVAMGIITPVENVAANA